MDLNDKMNELENKIKELDKKIADVKLREEEREESIPFGLISIVDDNLKLELLMSQDLFEEEDIKELEDILNNLQKLVIKISQRGENNGTNR